MVSLFSCDLDLTNPNAATDQEVLNSKDGLIALAIGIRQVYSTTALGSAILVPSVTTRETAIMTTFANLEELEEGGSKLSGENGYTSRLFAQMMRAKGMAEDLVDNVDNVSLEAGTSAGLKAWGLLFRAMCIGHLAHNFEQVAVQNSLNNDASFIDRMAAFDVAIELLQTAISQIGSGGVSDEFKSTVSSDIDLLNTCNLFLARYQLMRGNYSEAISAANKVDASSTSVFSFDNQNQNPVFSNLFTGTISYAPRTNFGLPASLPVDAGDMRVDFYLNIIGGSSLNVLPVEDMAASFYTAVDASIPVYRSGEIDLIIAEAEARSNNLGAAETALNRVRNKMPADDAFGIGAGLSDTYSSGGDQNALLAEIYKNRRIELFMIGTSLDDSRRFNRPEPPANVDLTTERNRNFYPYSSDERLNNPNTPNDPSI